MPASLKVLFVASECTPFAKTGGLGDVIGALPKALSRRGIEVRVVIPLYAGFAWNELERLEGVLTVPVGRGEARGAVRMGKLPKSDVIVYRLEHHGYFDRPHIYGPPGDGYPDNLERFTFLSRGALELCKAIGFYPDVVHANDWQTALVPVYIDTVEWMKPLHAAATLYTIHNLAYQGVFDAGALPLTGLGPEHYHARELEHFGTMNLTKAACYRATFLSTVSPTYAREIQTPSHGFGLDGVLAERKSDLFGVLNGIDTEEWNPEADPLIAAPFSAGSPAGKAECKRALQAECGLPVRAEVPVLGLVGRLTRQKGIDVVAQVLGRMLDLDLQLILLGSGDRDVEAYFAHMAARRPDRFAASFGFDNQRAHRIEAGADLFLMPSRFEPCGLNQLYSLRYGTLPIVRATGLRAPSFRTTSEPARAPGSFFTTSHRARFTTSSGGRSPPGTTAPITFSRCDRKRCTKTSRGTGPLSSMKRCITPRERGAAGRSLREEGMTSAMRAMVLERPDRAARSLIPKDLARPEATPGVVVARVRACGVCRSDLQLCEGDLAARRLPIVPGHQVVGTVESVGEGVDAWRPGDRLGVAWLGGACGACASCRRGRENLCEQAQFTGWDIHGGFATHVAVRADFALRLPDGFDDLAAAPLLCGGIIGYRSYRRSRVEPGGKLGLGFGAWRSTIQVARHFGCRVFVATRAERDRERARRLGAEWTGGYDDRPPEALDAAITFAPSGDVVGSALRAVGRGGTVAINAIHLDRLPQMPYSDLWWERNLTSVANFTREDAREFLQLASDIPIRTTFRYPLEQANLALERLRDGPWKGRRPRDPTSRANARPLVLSRCPPCGQVSGWFVPRLCSRCA
jgi:starch synthase